MRPYLTYQDRPAMDQIDAVHCGKLSSFHLSHINDLLLLNEDVDAIAPLSEIACAHRLRTIFDIDQFDLAEASDVLQQFADRGATDPQLPTVVAVALLNDMEPNEILSCSPAALRERLRPQSFDAFQDCRIAKIAAMLGKEFLEVKSVLNGRRAVDARTRNIFLSYAKADFEEGHRVRVRQTLEDFVPGTIVGYRSSAFRVLVEPDDPAVLRNVQNTMKVSTINLYPEH